MKALITFYDARSDQKQRPQKLIQPLQKHSLYDIAIFTVLKCHHEHTDVFHCHFAISRFDKISSAAYFDRIQYEYGNNHGNGDHSNGEYCGYCHNASYKCPVNPCDVSCDPACDITSVHTTAPVCRIVSSAVTTV